MVLRSNHIFLFIIMAMTKEDFSQYFVDEKTRIGLTDEQAEELRLKWGWNALEEVKISKVWLFIIQFTGTMPYMLWIAAIISGASEDWLDMGILLTMLFCNGVLGFREEVSSTQAVIHTALLSLIYFSSTYLRIIFSSRFVI